MRFKIDKQTELTREVISEYIMKHQQAIKSRFKRLKDAYNGYYDIYNQPAKPLGKPDNRVATPFAKYITDTFTGFFNGIPLEVKHDDDKVINFVDNFNDDNNTIDLDYELIKDACIFGHGAELIYQDEQGNTKVAQVSPMNTFVVYSNDIEKQPVFGVYYNYSKAESNFKGNVYTKENVYSFEGSGYTIDNLTLEYENVYGEVPINEYDFNKERQGIFEQELSMMNTYNKTMSDKANDIAYFSDAYLSVLGAELKDEDFERIRDSRIINLTPALEDSQAKIEFLGKPDADTSQEHLLERLKDDIFNSSMVANISDDDFGNASGISLRYKLLAMENLAKTVERNITKALKRRYKLAFSLETNLPTAQADMWKSLTFVFKRNLPVNILDEAQTLQALDGQVSDETKLEQASFISDAQTELKRMEEEEKKLIETPNFYQEKEVTNDEEQ